MGAGDWVGGGREGEICKSADVEYGKEGCAKETKRMDKGMEGAGGGGRRRWKEKGNEIKSKIRRRSRRRRRRGKRSYLQFK